MWKRLGSFEMLLVSLLFKFPAFVFLMFVFLLFSNDWTRNSTLWQPPRKGGLTQLHTRMCCNKKKGIVNITRRKSLSIVIVKIFVPIMKNAFKMHLISANTVALECTKCSRGLGGEGGCGGKPFWKSAFEPIVHRRFPYGRSL